MHLHARCRLTPGFKRMAVLPLTPNDVNHHGFHIMLPAASVKAKQTVPEAHSERLHYTTVAEESLRCAIRAYIQNPSAACGNGGAL